MRDRKMPLARLLIVLVAAASVTTSANGTRTDEIRALIKARVDAGRNTGMAVGTIEADGGTSFAAYGAQGDGALPLDAESVVEIGSITKAFTAILLADMVEGGEVRLDDPVIKHLRKGARMPERNGRQITLLDLATQSSALPRLPDNLKPANPANPYADYTVEQMYDFLARVQLTRDIGSQYEYSNLGVGLLGHALALRAARSYEALVTERILKPLGMDHTAITLSPWMNTHLVKGHNTQHRPVPNWDVPTLAGAGALRSTLHDMLLFAAANLAPPTSRLHRAMQATHVVRLPTGRPDLSIGLAWHIRRVDGHDIVWHNGGTAGYRTWMGFDKTRRIAAVVLTNSAHGADDLGFELLK